MNKIMSLGELRDEITHIVHGDWISYELLEKGLVSESDTSTVDALVKLVEQQEAIKSLSVLENWVQRHGMIQYCRTMGCFTDEVNKLKESVDESVLA